MNKKFFYTVTVVLFSAFANVVDAMPAGRQLAIRGGGAAQLMLRPRENTAAIYQAATLMTNALSLRYFTSSGSGSTGDLVRVSRGDLSVASPRNRFAVFSHPSSGGALILSPEAQQVFSDNRPGSGYSSALNQFNAAREAGLRVRERILNLYESDSAQVFRLMDMLVRPPLITEPGLLGGFGMHRTPLVSLTPNEAVAATFAISDRLDQGLNAGVVYRAYVPTSSLIISNFNYLQDGRELVRQLPGNMGTAPVVEMFQPGFQTFNSIITIGQALRQDPETILSLRDFYRRVAMQPGIDINDLYGEYIDQISIKYAQQLDLGLEGLQDFNPHFDPYFGGYDPYNP